MYDYADFNEEFQMLFRTALDCLRAWRPYCGISGPNHADGGHTHTLDITGTLRHLNGNLGRFWVRHERMKLALYCQKTTVFRSSFIFFLEIFNSCILASPNSFFSSNYSAKKRKKYLTVFLGEIVKITSSEQQVYNSLARASWDGIAGRDCASEVRLIPINILPHKGSS